MKERGRERVGEKCKYLFVVALCHIHFLVVAYRFVARIILTLARTVRAKSTCMHRVELLYFCQFFILSVVAHFLCVHK